MSLSSNGMEVLLNPAFFTDAEVLAYLDESLAISRSVLLERQLRTDLILQKRIRELAHERDQGGYSIGEVWRRDRLSCLSRDLLGSYLLGGVSPALKDYIEFHLRTIKCRYCLANLEDLQQQDQGQTSQHLRKRYFESSSGILQSRHRD